MALRKRTALRDLRSFLVSLGQLAEPLAYRGDVVLRKTLAATRPDFEVSACCARRMTLAEEGFTQRLR